jgi:hypothetical protein
MAASLIIEQDQGTYVGSRHSHNGYYAGDFSQPRYPAVVPSAGVLTTSRRSRAGS